MTEEPTPMQQLTPLHVAGFGGLALVASFIAPAGQSTMLAQISGGIATAACVWQELRRGSSSGGVSHV